MILDAFEDSLTRMTREGTLTLDPFDSLRSLRMTIGLIYEVEGGGFVGVAGFAVGSRLGLGVSGSNWGCGEG